MTAVEDAVELARLSRQAAADRADIARLRSQAAADQELIAQLKADGLALLDQVENLEVALRSARRIGAAVGVLMMLHKITIEDAFDMLRKTSQARQIKIRDLADEVVRTGMLRPV